LQQATNMADMIQEPQISSDRFWIWKKYHLRMCISRINRE